MKNRLINIGLAFLITAFSGMDIQAMADKYPLQITAVKKQKTAHIRIIGTLYGWSSLSEDITKQIDAFLEDGVTDVDVYINSPGGDVFIAAEIINQINRFTGHKTGTGGAIVASAATMIAIELDSFSMAENGQFMYHKPSAYLSGNEDKIESSLKLLKDLTAQYKSKYAVKTGKTEEQIEAAWSKGDAWLTASEAKEQKFISDIIPKTKINSEMQALFAACGAPIVPKLNQSETNMKNRNQIIAALKLSADATDEQIEAAVIAAQKKAEKVDAVTATAEINKKTQIDEFVAAMILAKKVKADQKENLVAMGIADFDALKKFANSLAPLEKPNPEQGDGDSDANRVKWTMEMYQEKDPTALAKMMAEKPEEFKKLEADYFGK